MKIKVMNAMEFRNTQTVMDKTNADMATLLNTSPRNIEGWRSGRKRITGPTAKLTRIIHALWCRANITIEEIHDY